jgi:hypothetical protein
MDGHYSLRICLMRAIASSTACSGLMPSVTMRWTAFAQITLVKHLVVPQIAGGGCVLVSQWACLGLHGLMHFHFLV